MAGTRVMSEDYAEILLRESNARAELAKIMAFMRKWNGTLTLNMKGIWEGEDYDKFSSDFKRDFDDHLQECQDLLDLLTSLSDVYKEYQSMESEISALNIRRE